MYVMFVEMDLVFLDSKEFCEVLTSNHELVSVDFIKWSYLWLCLACIAVFINSMLVVNTKEMRLTWWLQREVILIIENKDNISFI